MSARLFLFLLVALELLVTDLLACPGKICDCQVLGPDDDWNRIISGDPVDPFDACYSADVLQGKSVSFSFSDTTGVPIYFVHQATPTVNVSVEPVNSQSLTDPVPIRIAQASGLTGPRLIIAVNQETCEVHELRGVSVKAGTALRTTFSHSYSLKTTDYHAVNRDGLQSALTSGLPVLPGLLRYDEASKARITHAIAVAMPYDPLAKAWPAPRIGANVGEEPLATMMPPYGQRFRLMSLPDTSTLSSATKNIVAALREFGLIFAEYDSACTGLCLLGERHAQWPAVLAELGALLTGGDLFEAVAPKSGKPLVYANGLTPPQCMGAARVEATFTVTVSDCGSTPNAYRVCGCQPSECPPIRCGSAVFGTSGRTCEKYALATTETGKCSPDGNECVGRNDFDECPETAPVNAYLRCGSVGCVRPGKCTRGEPLTNYPIADLSSFCIVDGVSRGNCSSTDAVCDKTGTCVVGGTRDPDDPTADDDCVAGAEGCECGGLAKNTCDSGLMCDTIGNFCFKLATVGGDDDTDYLNIGSGAFSGEFGWPGGVLSGAGVACAVVLLVCGFYMMKGQSMNIHDNPWAAPSAPRSVSSPTAAAPRSSGGTAMKTSTASAAAHTASRPVPQRPPTAGGAAPATTAGGRNLPPRPAGAPAVPSTAERRLPARPPGPVPAANQRAVPPRPSGGGISGIQMM